MMSHGFAYLDFNELERAAGLLDGALCAIQAGLKRMSQVPLSDVAARI